MKNNLRTIGASGLILAGTLAALALPSMAAQQGHDRPNARPERTQVIGNRRETIGGARDHRDAHLDNRFAANRFAASRFGANRFEGHRHFVRAAVREAPRDWRAPQIPFWVARRVNFGGFRHDNRNHSHRDCR